MKIHFKKDLQNVNRTVSHDAYSKQSLGIVKEDSIGQIKKNNSSNILTENYAKNEIL